LRVKICHTAVHYRKEYEMTGSVLSSGRGEIAAVMAQSEQITEKHSTLRQEATGRAPSSSIVRHSTLKHSENADCANIGGQEEGLGKVWRQRAVKATIHEKEHITRVEKLELPTNVTRGRSRDMCSDFLAENTR